MNKRGIELSINFLVMLIIAIVVFGFSIAFVYNITRDASSTFLDNEALIDERINQLLCGVSDAICISGNDQIIPKGKFAVIGIGAYNVKQYRTRYDITIEFDEAFDGEDSVANDGEVIVVGGNADGIDFIDPSTRSGTVVGIEASKEAKEGTYIYNVFVESFVQNASDTGGETSHGTTLKKIRVTVR